MTGLSLLLAIASLAKGFVTSPDPGDYANLKADAADNALIADYTTDNGGPRDLIYNITGPYYYSDQDITLSYQTLSVDANDTSVVVGTGGSTVNLTHVTVIKEGYSTWLNQASSFGVNAAVNIANGSTAYIDHSNMTVHNGAANIFAYGNTTTVHVSNTDLYSSGPVAHGLYAAGNGTIYATNIRHYSGGNRCSSFSGDGPGGYLHIRDAVAHTTGIGSAIFYTVGESYGTNIVGVTENSPFLFADGGQVSVFENVDFTAGLLAGAVVVSTMDRQGGASVTFRNSRLTTTKPDMSALWFGNIIADARIVNTEINTASGILVIANTSQPTQEFDYFAGPEENPVLQPAEVTVKVSGSTLTGDIVAYNGSAISWSLADHSNWTGVARLGGEQESADFSISIDASSTWTLTGDVHLQHFANADPGHGNIRSQGFNIYYSPSVKENAWLEKKTVSLAGGGKIQPSESG